MKLKKYETALLHSAILERREYFLSHVDPCFKDLNRKELLQLARVLAIGKEWVMDEIMEKYPLQYDGNHDNSSLRLMVIIIENFTEQYAIHFIEKFKLFDNAEEDEIENFALCYLCEDSKLKILDYVISNSKNFDIEKGICIMKTAAIRDQLNIFEHIVVKLSINLDQIKQHEILHNCTYTGARCMSFIIDNFKPTILDLMLDEGRNVFATAIEEDNIPCACFLAERYNWNFNHIKRLANDLIHDVEKLTLVIELIDCAPMCFSDAALSYLETHTPNLQTVGSLIKLGVISSSHLAEACGLNEKKRKANVITAINSNSNSSSSINGGDAGAGAGDNNNNTPGC